VRLGLHTCVRNLRFAMGSSKWGSIDATAAQNVTKSTNTYTEARPKVSQALLGKYFAREIGLIYLILWVRHEEPIRYKLRLHLADQLAGN